MYDARTLSGWLHMRLALKSGVAGLLIFLLAGCASPFGLGGGWAYNPRTNTCERAAAGLSEDECRENVVAAATAMAAATQQTQARIATATAASSATAFARSLPSATPTETATPTPRPPTATPTNTPLPTATRTSTPLPTLAPTGTNTPNPTGTPQPSPTPPSGARLTVSPPKGKRGTTFALAFTGGQPNQRAQWVITYPTGTVERVPLPISASGNYPNLKYESTPTHPLGVYRNEIIQRDRVVATATFELTE